MKRLLSQIKFHFALNFPLPLWLMMLLGSLMLAPNYPRMVAALFVVMLITSLLSVMRENRSNDMMLIMPIKRGEVASGQVAFIVVVQLIYIAFTAVFAIIAAFVPFNGSTLALTSVGMISSAAFFGVMLGVYGVFNLAFFPLYFKGGKCSPSSMAVAVAVALICGGALYGIAETISQLVPGANAVFASLSLSVLPWQILTLAVGMGIYALTSLLAVKLSVKAYSEE